MGILDPTEQYLRLYRSQIRRALQILQKAQRYDWEPGRLWHSESMVSSDSGDWIAVDDVVKAIQILQEGQQ